MSTIDKTLYKMPRKGTWRPENRQWPLSVINRIEEQSA